jgi:hypothetical protein
LHRGNSLETVFAPVILPKFGHPDIGSPLEREQEDPRHPDLSDPAEPVAKIPIEAPAIAREAI